MLDPLFGAKNCADFIEKFAPPICHQRVLQLKNAALRGDTVAYATLRHYSEGHKRPPYHPKSTLYRLCMAKYGNDLTKCAEALGGKRKQLFYFFRHSVDNDVPLAISKWYIAICSDLGLPLTTNN